MRAHDVTPLRAGADGERFLFHVGGMALLTLVINGTTGAKLLKVLGLLDQSPAQARHISDARHKAGLSTSVCVELHFFSAIRYSIRQNEL